MAATRLEIHGPNGNAGVFAVHNDVAYMIRPGSDKIATYAQLKNEDEKVAFILANYDELEPLSQEAAELLLSRGITWSAE